MGCWDEEGGALAGLRTQRYREFPEEVIERARARGGTISGCKLAAINFTLLKNVAASWVPFPVALVAEISISFAKTPTPHLAAGPLPPTPLPCKTTFPASHL